MSDAEIQQNLRDRLRMHIEGGRQVNTRFDDAVALATNPFPRDFVNMNDGHVITFRDDGTDKKGKPNIGRQQMLRALAKRANDGGPLFVAVSRQAPAFAGDVVGSAPSLDDEGQKDRLDGNRLAYLESRSKRSAKADSMYEREIAKIKARAEVGAQEKVTGKGKPNVQK